MKKVYISGPMKGYDNLNVDMFNKAADFLAKQGFKTENPVHVMEAFPTATEREYIREDIFRMLNCDVVAVLPGYKESLGATTELFVANRYGLPIIDAFTLEKITIYTEFELCIKHIKQ